MCICWEKDRSKTASLPWTAVTSITTTKEEEGIFSVVRKYWLLPHPCAKASELKDGCFVHSVGIIASKANLPWYSSGRKDNSPLLGYMLALFIHSTNICSRLWKYGTGLNKLSWSLQFPWISPCLLYAAKAQWIIIKLIKMRIRKKDKHIGTP